MQITVYLIFLNYSTKENDEHLEDSKKSENLQARGIKQTESIETNSSETNNRPDSEKIETVRFKCVLCASFSEDRCISLGDETEDAKSARDVVQRYIPEVVSVSIT